MEQDSKRIQFNDSVPVLMLPSAQKLLMLPNVNIAEFVVAAAPEPLASSPRWLLGMVAWRGLQVPLIAFELLNGDVDEVRESSTQIAILNGISGREELPFYAIRCTGRPRQAKISEDDLAHDDAATAGRVESSQVLLAGESAVIPDLVVIEAQICRVLLAQ